MIKMQGIVALGRNRLSRARRLLNDSTPVALYAWDVIAGCRIQERQWDYALKRANGDLRRARELFAQYLRQPALLWLLTR